jgi:hypothetical protein
MNSGNLGNCKDLVSKALKLIYYFSKAICWGLCIFSSSFDTSNQFFENDISKCNMLLKRMIDSYETIFKT